MADQLLENDMADELDEGARRKSRRVWSHPFTLIRRVFGHAVFSSLTRRILFFNIAATVVLVGGILYLNQWRAGLIEARVQVAFVSQGRAQRIPKALRVAMGADPNGA